MQLYSGTAYIRCVRIRWHVILFVLIAGGCPADGVCDLRVVQPVCGIDDITYQSACLAACQDVAVKKPEPCKPADARQFPRTTPTAGVVADEVSSSAQTSVAAFEMNRFVKVTSCLEGVQNCTSQATREV